MLRKYIPYECLGSISHVTLDPFMPLPVPKRLAQTMFGAMANLGIVSADNVELYADELGLRVHGGTDGTKRT